LAPTSTAAVTAVLSTAAIGAGSVRVYSPAEVCALVSQEVAASTLGVDVTSVEPSELSTPQCSFNFTTPDGVRGNVTLAVQRPIDDLGGRAGEAGFEHATSLVIFDTPYVPLEGLGDRAAVSASESLTIIAVLAQNQVYTIATSAGIGTAPLVGFGAAVAAGL